MNEFVRPVVLEYPATSPRCPGMPRHTPYSQPWRVLVYLRSTGIKIGRKDVGNDIVTIAYKKVITSTLKAESTVAITELYNPNHLSTFISVRVSLLLVLS